MGIGFSGFADMGNRVFVCVFVFLCFSWFRGFVVSWFCRFVVSGGSLGVTCRHGQQRFSDMGIGFAALSAEFRSIVVSYCGFVVSGGWLVGWLWLVGWFRGFCIGFAAHADMGNRFTEHADMGNRFASGADMGNRFASHADMGNRLCRHGHRVCRTFADMGIGFAEHADIMQTWVSGLQNMQTLATMISGRGRGLRRHGQG